MKQYLVTWEIDITAESPKEAALQAMEIQRDLDSEAIHFQVKTQSTGKVTDVYLDEIEIDDAPSLNVRVAPVIKIV